MNNATKRDLGGICASFLMRLGKNDFEGASRLLNTLRTRFDEWMEARPEKKKVEARKERDAELITVCDHCLQASCWQGDFYCDDYKTAGTVQMTRRELKLLDRESSDYWKTDQELAAA